MKIKICVSLPYRATERPKGTAFVKFASEESAKKCVDAAVALTGANATKGKAVF